MTRSRSTNRLGWRALLLLLALGGSPAVRAQPTTTSEQPLAPGSAGPTAAPAPVATPGPTAATEPVVTPAPVATAPSSNWPLVLGVLGGIALGVLGARMWARSSTPKRRHRSGSGRGFPPNAVDFLPAEPVRKKAENVPRAPAEAPAAASPEPSGKVPKVQSMRQAQGTPPVSRTPEKQARNDKKKKPNINSRTAPSAERASSWPTIAPRSAAMNPTTPNPGEEPLEPGQTIEWAAPTSTPPAIQELIAASAPEAAAAPAEASAIADAAAVAPSNGPLHYYAPAPDVPSIEHRKLSPNPLPQMPLLITLPHSEATTAQFSFSPQADQSRIIGNGVRELKEFFQFELPPTEQFTSITNLTAGKLEKRDDAWHVVQKAGIALS
ncbi:hypothetical protein ACFST9_21875 [Hymenobacter monticola]|uniref:Uncharacterized protein n=2 Tax=Hymenobacter monticola TaxID=1705399 RepID=A0ABY4B517_9BACT|nr:hypothetical protein [Hymenobacter monticola]UOE34249.1 hypothetical protein MTP16_01030 [Hymenobacter monticola]